MFLKRLEINGFKSFAEKSVLDFESGKEGLKVTAVVGPNGSGKSNVVDAIKWVLGEQSYKALRSKKSEDVVFFGSAKRKKGSAALVSLVLDNSKKEIPLDFSEVTIARKVYRSGETDYQINSSKVRLFDVQELLSKCGFGQTTYTVLGQGMVDQLLFYGPAERKILFDEAAGVKQYQLKREQSLRKLEATDQNILKARAVYSEIAPRLKFLKKQLEKANEKKVFEDQLAELQMEYYSFKIQELLDLIQKKEAFSKKIALEIEDLKKDLKEQSGFSSSEQIFNLQRKLSLLESEKDEIKSRFLVLSANLEIEERKESIETPEAFLREKKGKEDQKSALRERLEENEKKIKTLDKELAELAKEISLVQTKLLDTQAALKKESSGNETLLAVKGEFQSLEKEYEEISLLLGKGTASDISKAKAKVEEALTSFRKLWEKVKSLTQKDNQSEILEKIELVSKEKAVLQEKLNKVNLETNLLKNENYNLNTQIQIIEKEILEIDKKIKDFGELSKDNSRLEELKKSFGKEKKDLEEKEKEIALLKQELSDLFSKKEKEEKEWSEAREKNQIIQENINSKNFELRDSEIELAKLETRLDDLKEEAKRERIKADSLKEEAPSGFDHLKAEEKIISLKKKVAAIGEIDIDSEEELGELEEKYIFLGEQLGDLEQAKEDLKKVIEELDTRIKKQFNEAFEKISLEFKKYFKILFNGGEAGLSMEKQVDEETGEESFGIEIFACPPGKKVKSLHTLSGGERSLASLALLFAILSVNPSPFVVLDEVDAALDEANTKCFLKIVEALSKDTQFIIITHNKDTMKSADSLYGVTMDDTHVSKLLSLKLSEVETTK
ncbi:MAG: AAA family ATPase [Patescibacteria group bacterium]|nr:AAA family ATPase [Patescibacteria group bacterium]